MAANTLLRKVQGMNRMMERDTADFGSAENKRQVCLTI